MIKLVLTKHKVTLVNGYWETAPFEMPPNWRMIGRPVWPGDLISQPVLVAWVVEV
jgi:hypothetical protein